MLDLENEIHEHKVQASSAKNKYADWNNELQKKLQNFREEKKAWLTEAGKLRTAEKETRVSFSHFIKFIFEICLSRMTQALFEAQARLLAEAVTQVFQLQTQQKESQHKIDRLRDYEERIDQHIQMQRLWLVTVLVRRRE